MTPLNSDTPHFRLAAPEDWPAIWEIFREVIRSGDTYAFPPDMPEAEAREAWLFDGAGNRHTFVALLDDAIVGTAYLKPNQIGLGDHVANAGWMVAARAAGRGVGRRFAEYVLDEARRVGFQAMQFNAVVATNTRALALWESMGFTVIGTSPEAFRHSQRGLVDVHIMYQKL
jgi:L-amino acid N-acyltransferase YncA